MTLQEYFRGCCNWCDVEEVRKCLDNMYQGPVLSPNEEFTNKHMRPGEFSIPLTHVCYDALWGNLPNSSERCLATAALLLDRGADVNKLAGGRGDLETPLRSACSSSQVKIELLQLLLSRGAEVDLSEGEEGTTPLMELCSKRHPLIEETKFLLDHGANPNLVGRSWGTALHEAVVFFSPGCDDQLRLVRLLLEYGADANGISHRGRTPLELANSHPRMRALLRKHCAIIVRKHVIGGSAEHPSRNRLKHLAPQIAAWLI